MLYREIIAVCSEIHTKHINTLCGQNVEFVNVKPGGTETNHNEMQNCEGRGGVSPRISFMFVVRFTPWSP
jgi:hypothetical protein